MSDVVETSFKKRASSSSSTASACTLIFETNGGSKIDSLSVERGTRVSLSKYTPKRTGYTFAGWYLDKKLTDRVTSVKVDSSMSVYAKWTYGIELPFVDVKSGDWFYDSVEYVWLEGLMNGTAATRFAPYANTTRGMIVTILARMEGGYLRHAVVCSWPPLGDEQRRLGRYLHGRRDHP